jgi:DNA helicase-2/ATP-dependent DNA helicase PcrA
MADFGHNAVTLLTLHAAKGLEFPVVFITGLEEGLFPLSTSMDERKDLEEERRLMYVGVTRAMKKLYLSYAMKRYQFGDISYSVRSRFLDEIDQRLLAGSLAEVVKSHRAYRRPVTQEDRDNKQYLSDPMPAYEDESQEPVQARVGAQVYHESFGKGRVIAIDGRGESARAIVDFESVGRKHLMLKFARLRSG